VVGRAALVVSWASRNAGEVVRCTALDASIEMNEWGNNSPFHSPRFSRAPAGAQAATRM
jgi:hypothetical protein